MAICCIQPGFSAYAGEWDDNSPPQMTIDFHAGDVDLNHTVNILDVILLNRVVLGKETLSDMQSAVADINQDHQIDAADSLCILKMLVGIEL